MIELDIPGWGKRSIEHVVLDFNGTLAAGGKLIAGVADRLPHLSIRARIHICSADTFGTVDRQTKRFDTALKILEGPAQDQQKAELVRHLGPLKVIAIGNGRNDVAMLREATLGIAVVGPEGASPEALSAAQVVCANINDALDLLLEPLRLTATLRR
jgi:soluble P-type ATPase